MARKKQEKEKLLTPQEAYVEATRYLENAKEALRKAGKEDYHYRDRKYVRTACGVAYLGALIACDGFLAMRGVQLPKKRTIDFYREHIAKLDGKLLRELNAAYDILHLWGYYEGIPSVSMIKDGFDIACRILDRIKPAPGAAPSTEQPRAAAWRGTLPVVFGGALLLPSLRLWTEALFRAFGAWLTDKTHVEAHGVR
ncbi:MAG: DUF5618 family protein, partial [Prevotellaceae bacterium]|nr:DUF5618 family protein [Prevotellaceae bacterium]